MESVTSFGEGSHPLTRERRLVADRARDYHLAVTRDRTQALTALVLGTVFLFGVGNCLYYGREGLMPLDQSIVFDAGWRIVSGQVPFRDFFTPVAVVPGYMQAGFFLVFGVSWFSYVLHAALLNGVYSAVVVLLLRRCRLDLWSAGLCGLASGVCFYTPMGTPYADQHGFFFIVLALWCAACPGRSGRRIQAGLMSAPICLGLAVLSKQNPGFLGALPVLGACAWPREGLTCRSHWLSLVVGSAIVAGFGLWATMFWPARESVVTYFWTMPFEEGLRRGRSVAAAQLNLMDWQFLRNVGFHYLRYLPTVIAALVLVVVGRIAWLGVRRPRVGVVATDAWPVGLTTYLAASLYAVTVVFIVFTSNQTENGVALIPLIVGLTLAALLQFRRGLGGAEGRLAMRVAFVGVQVVALVALGAESVAFQSRVNRSRMVNDLKFDETVAAAASGQLPAAMSFLRWNAVGVVYTPEDLTTLVSFLRTHPGNILVLSDSLFLYGMTGRPSVNPNLWYHPGLTIPVHAPEDAAFDAKYRESLARYRPRYVIHEAYRTWKGFVPMAAPVTRAWFAASRCQEIDLTASIRIFECPGA